MTGLEKTLNGIGRIAPRLYKAGEKKGTRKVSGGRTDDVTSALADCTTPGEIGAIALKFGLKEEEVLHHGKKAPNFGQFRMVIGNRVRGTVNKLERAAAAGIKMTAAEAAYSRVPKNPKGKATKSKTAKAAKTEKGAAKKAAAIAKQQARSAAKPTKRAPKAAKPIAAEGTKAVASLFPGGQATT